MATILTLNEDGEAIPVTVNSTEGIAKPIKPLEMKKQIKRKDLEEAFIPETKGPLSSQQHQEMAQGHLEDMKHPENDNEQSHTQYQYHMGMHHLKKAEEAEKYGAKVTAARHRSLAKDFGVLHEASQDFTPSRTAEKPKFPVTARDMSKSSKQHESQINDQSDLKQAEYWHRKHADAYARKDKPGMEEAADKVLKHLERHLQNIQHAELARHFAKMHHMISYDDARAAGNKDLAETHLKKSKEFDY